MCQASQPNDESNNQPKHNMLYVGVEGDLEKVYGFLREVFENCIDEVGK